MLQLTFIDTESHWDEHLHNDYRALNCKHRDHRMASKRIFAAAALDISIDADGAVSIGGLSSWTEFAHGDEAAVVGALFDHLRFRPDHKAVTYGGLAADLPLLTLASMEYALILPGQLRSGHRVRPGELWPHTDLALSCKGKGRDWAHLSEVGLRLGFPRELFMGKSQVTFPTTPEQWQAVRHHVGFDCVLTAMVALAWMGAQGRFRIDTPAMIYQLSDWFLRNGGGESAMSEPLAELRRRMAERIACRFAEAA